MIQTRRMRADKTRDRDVYAIIGAAMEAHRELGTGFIKTVYQEALERELMLREIPYVREKDLKVMYKGRPLDFRYRVDFICFDSVIVELKAVTSLSTSEDSQIMNHLKAAGLKKGLILNFGSPRLEHRRVVYEPRLYAESVDTYNGGRDEENA